MPELILRFLGVPELTLDNAPVHLSRQRSLALLAYLAITGRPHTRDELAALLSGEAVGSQERKLLRNALTSLAEQLGDYLLTNRQTIAFNAALPHRLDVAALDALLANGAADPVALELVVAHFGEELLAGLSLRDAPLFETWLLRARAQVRQQLTHAAHRLLEDALHRNELAKGIALARRLLAIEPWQEDIHRQLMHLFARDGQRDAALAQYQECRRALAAELGVEPQPETMAFYERLRAGPFVPRHNLTAPPTALIGREEELAELTRLLADPACRLVTIVGLGGSGKTRLAGAVGAHFVAPILLADDHPFPDGCFLVDLSGISGAGSGQEAAVAAERRIAMTVGLVLGLVFYGHIDRLDQLVAYLGSKRMLLILDGLERLVPGVEALRKILTAAPGVTLLATTRTHLGIPEAHERNLGRLALPAGPATLEQAPASQLFLTEAARVNAHLTAEDRGHVATICRLVDGLPLALIIAASWLRALSCAQIARDLERGGKLFQAPVRHQSGRREGLYAILAFAWRSLPARERRALRSLIVFAGQFDNPAAAAIGIDLASVLVLCEHALIERTAGDRYQLHPLIRQYGAEQLAHWPVEEARVRARHAAYYAALIARMAPELYERPEAHATVATNRANLLSAWEWAVAHLDLALLAQMRTGLALWHQMRGLHREWTDFLEEAITRLRAAGQGAADPALTVTLGWLLADSADALHWQGELERVFRQLAEARQCARAIGMIPLEGYVSLYEGRDLHYQGNGRGASVQLQQALTLSRAIVDRRLEAQTLQVLSGVSADNGDYAEAESYLQLAEEVYRELGDRRVISWLALHRGLVSLTRGDLTRARISLEQSLRASRQFGHTSREGWAHAYLGVVCDLDSGHHREADEHFTRAFAIARETGEPYQDAYLMRVSGDHALHTGDLELAESYLQEALHRYSALRNPSGISRTLLSLGRLALARGDVTAVEEAAKQTLILANDAGRRHEEALADLLLGRARAIFGDQTEAIEAYWRALARARELALPALCCDAETGLASVALARGEAVEAAIHAEAALAYVQHLSLAVCEEPEWVAITCYHALDAAHDQRADAALQLGATLIEQKVASFPAQSQRRYLEACPAAREVLALWHQRQSAEGPSGAPLSLLQAAAHAADKPRVSGSLAQSG